MTNQLTAQLPASETAARTASGRDPDKVHDAAQQFEALLLGQMLRSAREDAWQIEGLARFTRLLGEMVLIERLANKSLNYGLATHVQLGSGLVEFLQHGGREINVDPLNRLHHLATVGEEAGNILPGVRHSGNGLGRNGLLGFTRLPHHSCFSSRVARGATSLQKLRVRTRPASNRL
jgi:hypothetical protein